VPRQEAPSLIAKLKAARVQTASQVGEVVAKGQPRVRVL